MRGVLKPREERIAGDAYFTPRALAEAICYRIGCKLESHSVLEPSAGAGAFMDAARKRWEHATIFGMDTNPQRGDVICGDFLAGPGTPKLFSLIIGNPPYLDAEAFVHRALASVEESGHVAFLLRLSFLAGQKRVRTLWHLRNLRWLFPIAPRPSFTPDGKTDAAEYALFVWQFGFHGNAELLAPLVWSRGEPRAAPRKSNEILALDPEEAA